MIEPRKPPTWAIDPLIADWYRQHGTHKEYMDGTRGISGEIEARREMVELTELVAAVSQRQNAILFNPTRFYDDKLELAP